MAKGNALANHDCTVSLTNSRVEELKKWFKENKDLALGFDTPTTLDETAVQSIRSRPSSPVKQSNNAATNVKTSPVKAAPVRVEDNSKTNTNTTTNTKKNSDTVRTEVMNTVFIVKNSVKADNKADTGPLELIKKEAPHYGKHRALYMNIR